MAAINYRTIDVDALDPDSSSNFDLSTLIPSVTPVSSADVQHNGSQARQLLRSGDSEGALRSALESAPYGADDRGKVSRLYHIYQEPFESCKRHPAQPFLNRKSPNAGSQLERENDGLRLITMGTN